jgi:hypothetical protein
VVVRVKDAFYFPHDSNARQDIKILKLRTRHGWSGYGLYWGIVEALRDQDEYCFESDDRELISLAIGCTVDELLPVLDTCIEVGLLVEEDGYIYSPSLTRRMVRMDEIREKRREAGEKGGKASQSKSKEEANGQANGQAKNEDCLSIKEKKRKGNKEKNLNTPAQAQDGASTKQKDERTRCVEEVFEKNFWPVYPRKRGKNDALKAFKKLLCRPVSPEQCKIRWKNICLNIDALLAEGRPPDKIPYPATFLRKENFDEPPAEIKSNAEPEYEWVEVDENGNEIG